MFACRLRSANHVRQYSVRATASLGWEVRVEQDRRVSRLAHYSDWHRVEHVLASFEREVLELTGSGWRIVDRS